jgi:hypothetical protein
MVWFNNLVEIFTRLNFYRRVAFFILSLDRISIGTALIYIVFYRGTVIRNSLAQKAKSSLGIRLGR